MKINNHGIIYWFIYLKKRKKENNLVPAQQSSCMTNQGFVHVKQGLSTECSPTLHHALSGIESKADLETGVRMYGGEGFPAKQNMI